MKVRTMFLLTLPLTTFAWITPMLANAATYYVAKTGNNGYTCAQAQSVSTPKLTIAAGLSCMQGGDTLIIKAGTYGEAINYNQIPAGTSNARTTIQALPGEIVILRPTTGGEAGDAVWLYVSYITLDGFIIDAANVTVNGIRINNGASHVIIRNMEVKNSPGFGCITFQNPPSGNSPSTNVQVINSRLHHCGTTDQHHGIYLRGNNHLVEHNEIYNNSGHGVHQWNIHNPDNNNNIVRHNYVHNNGSRGILIGSGSDNIAHHNIVTNNSAYGIAVGFNTTNNNQVYNNTIYANSSECIEVRFGATNSKVKNNLCLSNGKNTILNNGTGSVIAKNQVSTDPTLVVDAKTNQFNPREGSALIDAGENIAGFSAGKFVGLAPDQGAVEAGQVAPTPKAPMYLQVSP